MSSSDIFIYFILFEGGGSNCCPPKVASKLPLAPENPAATNAVWVIVIVLPPLYFLVAPENKSSSLSVITTCPEPFPNVPAAKVIVSPTSYKLPVSIHSIVDTDCTVTVALNLAVPSPVPDVEDAAILLYSPFTPLTILVVIACVKLVSFGTIDVFTKYTESICFGPTLLPGVIGLLTNSITPPIPSAPGPG